MKNTDKAREIAMAIIEKVKSGDFTQLTQIALTKIQNQDTASAWLNWSLCNQWISRIEFDIKTD